MGIQWTIIENIEINVHRKVKRKKELLQKLFHKYLLYMYGIETRSLALIREQVVLQVFKNTDDIFGR